MENLTTTTKMKSVNWEVMFRKLLTFFGLSAIFVFLLNPGSAWAAGSISPSGGGTFTVGQNFTVRVVASGTTFESFQGYISVSGAASIVSFSPGGAFWAPGSTPANNQTFAGGVSPTSSFTIATITLKGSKTGTGKVTVSSVQLVHNGSVVSTTGGTASFTINPAPTPPGQVSVSSSSHPDPNQSYEATTAVLSWTPPANGASGYAVVFNQTADTVPEAKITTTATTASYPNLAVGTYFFHIRANNKDGWSDTTHFKINVKPTTDSSLAIPAIKTIDTTSDHTNDITAGTVSGITISGTGPVGYAIALTFDPDLKLDPTKYPSPTTSDSGDWQLTITDPIKASFYTVSATGRKDSTVSATSPTVSFEVLVSDGGSVKIITDADQTATFQQAQAAKTRVAAAEAKRKQAFVWGGVGGLALITVAALLFFFRRKLFAGIKI